MDSRIGRSSKVQEKQRKKQERAVRLKQVYVVVLCIVFFISAVYIVDMSTRKMMLSKDDKHAIGLYGAGTDVLRVDLAGEHYMLNYKEAKEMTGSLLKESEKAIKNIVEKVKSKVAD